MNLTFSDTERALRDEVRAYFADLVPPDVQHEVPRGELGGPVFRRLFQQMGADGWLGIGWPTEHGGQGRSSLEQFIFFDEAERAGAPIPFLTIKSIGPVLMAFGTDEQRADILPRILSGSIHFAIGYTEPDAGTDLAALRTKATRDGDDYVIDGAKIFTSYAHDADYIWLAARTSTGAKKHQGISIFIVPIDAPGLTITPIGILPGGQTNATFYDGVRVPASSMVGAEGEGWSLIMAQLNFERVAMAPPGMVARALSDVVTWARTPRADGSLPIDDPGVAERLATVYAHLEVLKLLNWKIATDTDRGTANPADSSATKVFGTEFYVEAFQILLEVLGPEGYLATDSPDAMFDGRLEHEYRIPVVMTFGGGTNEVQRDIISMFGLGLPRVER